MNSKNITLEKQIGFADTLPDTIRKKARKNAIFSALFGCISEQAIDTNTLLILYLVMLGGNDSFSMFSTAISGLAFAVLSIPSAGLVDRWGLRKSYSWAIYAQALMLFIIAAAPWTGRFAVSAVIGAFTIFCILRTFYAATWFPIVDNFLKADERGPFFGTMRFVYMNFNMFLIFGVGYLMGDEPPLLIIQSYFAIAALGLLGRKFFLDKLPMSTDRKTRKIEILPALKISIRNNALVCFSIYYGFLNMAALAAMPLAVIYMKNFLHLSSSTIMLITATGILGQIIGFSLIGRLTQKLGIGYFELLTHLLFVLAIGLLIFTSRENTFNSCTLGTAFFLNGMASAFLICIGSIEMLALARPGNKVMAMAFVSTFQYLGNALGRAGSSLILALGIFAPVWNFGGYEFSYFHTIFILNSAIILLGLILLMIVPAASRNRENYYEP